MGLAVQTEPPNPKQPDIVGGQEAEPGAWPWQVAIVEKINIEPGPDYYFALFCGGSLVTQYWVVTAAHCIVDEQGTLSFDASELAIVAGIRTLSTPEAGFQQIDVAELVPHPNYDPTTMDNDLALLRLAHPVSFGMTAGGEYVYRIPIVPETIRDLAGEMATVTGWGDIAAEQLGVIADKLQQVEVPILDNSTCNDKIGPGITSNMLCAGYSAGGKDSCQGDSGGPLVIQTGGQWQQAGVVSFGFGCAQPNSPGVYTRLSKYADWIEENISELDPWCIANQQTWDENARTCTVGSGSEIISGPLTILSGENLANYGTITMNNDQHIINDGTIGNYGTISNEGEIDNFGLIDNEGIIDNFWYIYNEGSIINFDGTIDNFGLIENYGTIWNNSIVYNYHVINNYGNGTIWNQGWNNGIIWNRDTINNAGTIWNNSIVYNIGAITVNPVINYEYGIVYEMHNHVQLPHIISSD